MVYHPGAGHTHIEDALRLSDAVKRPGHEGVILHRVGKNHQLRAAEAPLICRALRRLLDDPAHKGPGIHIDPRLLLR